MLKKIPITQIMTIIDNQDDDSMVAAMELNKELIYKCCPMLHDKSLQVAYECVEPYDIVLKVFEDNVGEIEQVCKVIMSMYGMSKDIVVELKN